MRKNRKKKWDLLHICRLVTNKFLFFLFLFFCGAAMQLDTDPLELPTRSISSGTIRDVTSAGLDIQNLIRIWIRIQTEQIYLILNWYLALEMKIRQIWICKWILFVSNPNPNPNPTWTWIEFTLGIYFSVFWWNCKKYIVAD